MRDLTDKQREVLDFMRSFVAKHGVPPTVREIGDRFKVTPRAAFDHLRALERKGALQGRGEDLFALRVRGESMIQAHICDGDLVLVRRQDSASPNDIVVALVESESGEGEATVKRFSREGERVVL